MTADVQPPVLVEPRGAGTGPAQVELTPHERVALITVAMGITQGAAARRLGTSERSIRRALVSAVERLGARSQAHAVVLAALADQLDLSAVERGELPEWPSGPTLEQLATRARIHREAAEAHAPHLEYRRSVVARLLAEEVPVAEIAVRVGVSASTVYADRMVLAGWG